MSEKKIFIFEFIAGGGFNKEKIPSSLFCEGYGMLRVIIEDFKKLGFKISTLLDDRIISLSKFISADIIESVLEQEEYLQKFVKMVEKNNFCFIIAPEFSNILFDLTKIVKDHKKTLLSIDLEGVSLGTSKIKTYNYFIKSNVKTPRTFLIPKKDRTLSKDFLLEKFKELSKPIIIKPNDGVGANSIFYFESERDIFNFLNTIDQLIDLTSDFLLQEYIEGEDLSASLIGTHLNPLILSINTQNINIKSHNSSEYIGGTTPINNFEQVKLNLKGILKNLDLTMFRGYFGLDFILKPDGTIYLIEINPRLTTSYLGIRNISDSNITSIIFETIQNNQHIFDYTISGHSHYLRIELEKIATTSQLSALTSLTDQLPEAITPLISLEDSNHFSCFIATKTIDSDKSLKKIEEIIKIFEHNSFIQTKSS
ncbi:MAG: ATP-grasp domain-containing protein [Promethearchaeota archaeon]